MQVSHKAVAKKPMLFKGFSITIQLHLFYQTILVLRMMLQMPDQDDNTLLSRPSTGSSVLKHTTYVFMYIYIIEAIQSIRGIQVRTVSC